MAANKMHLPRSSTFLPLSSELLELCHAFPSASVATTSSPRPSEPVLEITYAFTFCGTVDSRDDRHSFEKTTRVTVDESLHGDGI